MDETIWIDGTKTTTCLTNDRGLAYGDGVFETIRVVKGRLTLVALHMIRLKNGCKRLSIPADWCSVTEQLNKFIRSNYYGKDGVVKIIITRVSQRRGYSPHGGTSRCILQWFSTPTYPEKNYTTGVSLYSCALQLGWQPQLAGIKHLNRLEQVLARQEWQSENYAEGLLTDYQGNIIECTMSNIFLLYGDKLITPDLSHCGVAGVMRQWILSLSGLPVAVEIGHLPLNSLEKATELFICNSIFGIWPVVACQNYRWQAGNLTRYLQEKAESVFHDEAMD